MFNLRHGYLERVRKNPKEFWSLNDPDGTYFPPYTYNKGLKGALGVFHQRGINAASNHLDKYLNRLKNEKRKEDVWNRFNDYMAKYTKLGCKMIILNSDFKIPLANNIQLSGKCFRIDKDALGNYYIYLTGNNTVEWINELRFPLIQQYYSEYFKVDLTQINIGILDLNSVEHRTVCFDVEYIETAFEEARSLCSDIINTME